jgi:hypothetical protein
MFKVALILVVILNLGLAPKMVEPERTEKDLLQWVKLYTAAHEAGWMDYARLRYHIYAGEFPYVSLAPSFTKRRIQEILGEDPNREFSLRYRHYKEMYDYKVMSVEEAAGLIAEGEQNFYKGA